MRTAKGKDVLLALIDGCEVRSGSDSSWKNLQDVIQGHSWAYISKIEFKIDDSTRKREGLDPEEAYRALKDGCEVQASSHDFFRMSEDKIEWNSLAGSNCNAPWIYTSNLFGPVPFRITKLPGETDQKNEDIAELKNKIKSIENEVQAINKRLMDL